MSGDGVAVRVGGDDGDGVALDRRAGLRRGRARPDAPAPAGQALGIEAALDGHGHDRGIGQVAIAVLEGELGGLDDEMHVLVLRDGREIEALEQGQDGERGEALGGRRKAGRLAPAVRHAQGLDPVGAMRGEILDGQRAAGLSGGAGDAPRQIAPVELLGAVRGDALEGLREIGLDEALRGETVGVIDRPQRAPDLRRAPRRRTAPAPTPSRAAGRLRAGSPRARGGWPARGARAR